MNEKIEEFIKMFPFHVSEKFSNHDDIHRTLLLDIEFLLKKKKK